MVFESWDFLARLFFMAMWKITATVFCFAFFRASVKVKVAENPKKSYNYALKTKKKASQIEKLRLKQGKKEGKKPVMILFSRCHDEQTRLS